VGIVEDDIERVREASPLGDVVQQYVALRRVGRRSTGLCPFHAEKTPSFSVNEEIGRYYCFGCGAKGDVFSFVQDLEHLDFAAAVEWLANRAGITLRYTSGGEGRERQRRKRLVEAVSAAAEWYHQRLLTAPDARPAREYLRSRGITGDVARQFRLGWAPDEWDALVQGAGIADELLVGAGLAFTNRRDRLQDTFRARLLFPILNEAGEAIAFGGRVLPGSTDPAKYKNSPETAIYAKSKTLYGLSWAKADIVQAGQVVVCEGYTDVIGFHRAGIPRAVATCGTALTEDHVRLLKRYASRVVLAFDADAAGLAAAERFYEWERAYELSVSVARLPGGVDPADLAGQDPASLAGAVEDARPFLSFRVDRVLSGADLRTNEARASAAEAALAVVNEHPNELVRRQYAAEVAMRCGLSPDDLVRLASHQHRRPRVVVARTPERREVTAESTVLVLALDDWPGVRPWLHDALFDDPVHRAAFRSLDASGGDLTTAVSMAEPAAADLLQRLVVEEPAEDPPLEVFHLIRTAALREVGRLRAEGDAPAVATVRRLEQQLTDPDAGPDAAAQLLGWLETRVGERV
jgi:DNA primase